MVLPPAQWPPGIDQAGSAGDVVPGLIIAVQVADGDDPLRLAAAAQRAATASSAASASAAKRTIRLKRAAADPFGMSGTVASRAPDRQWR